MATAPKSNNSNDNQQLPTDPCALARYGISLIINNESTRAREIFESNLHSIQMAAGYSFSVFMDALLSFEDEKLQMTLNILRDTEKKCAENIGWLKSMRNRVFGQKLNLAERLETQIILADTQVCVAIITFLQQEFTGYLKGGWVMRKAWKVYQHTYSEISKLYEMKFGEFNLPEPTDFDWKAYVNKPSTTEDLITGTGSTQPDSNSSNNPTSETPESQKNIRETNEWLIPESLPSTTCSTKNGYVPISSEKTTGISQSHSSYLLTTPNDLPASMRRSTSAYSSLSNNNVGGSASFYSLWSPISSQLASLGSSLNLLGASEEETIDSDTLMRLMGAVCFGYGVLQLGVSLLPPSLLKVTHFLGFHGNRVGGISNLMYARKGSDMRAPLATLALLWFHTIVRPFYALDGSNVKAGIDAANLLIQESNDEYEQSALFLFFKGRVHRLDSNIALALESFQASANNSSQREIKLLALHEVGWCHLIQLDYAEAYKVFLNLKHNSRWSKAFYAYLTIICFQTVGRREFHDIKELRDLYNPSANTKFNQLDIFLKRRLTIFPFSENQLAATSNFYWKFFIFELIYLWNALASCSLVNIQNIIHDCTEYVREEPMSGIAMLIQGECYSIIGAYDQAIESYRNCISIRAKSSSIFDTHISANAEFSLGSLLIRKAETKEEGKMLLQHASQYKDYDFDNKLNVRISMALRNLS